MSSRRFYLGASVVACGFAVGAIMGPALGQVRQAVLMVTLIAFFIVAVYVAPKE